MLTQKKASKKKIITYLILIVIILGAIGYIIYRTFFMSLEKPVGPVVSSAVALPPKVETNFNKEIFDSSLFKDLKMHGDLPVKARNQGRTNPFESSLADNY